MNAETVTAAKCGYCGALHREMSSAEECCTLPLCFEQEELGAEKFLARHPSGARLAKMKDGNFAIVTNSTVVGGWETESGAWDAFALYLKQGAIQ